MVTLGVRRVLLVEDDPDHQALMRVSLDRTDRYVVVGVASTAQAAVTEAKRLRPDVVLLDLHLRDSSGFDSLADLLVCVPTALIVAISGDADRAAQRRAVAAGAFACIPKTAELYATHELATIIDNLTERFTAMLAGIETYTPVRPWS